VIGVDRALGMLREAQAKWKLLIGEEYKDKGLNLPSKAGPHLAPLSHLFSCSPCTQRLSGAIAASLTAHTF
jgi:hypothetical protein